MHNRKPKLESNEPFHKIPDIDLQQFAMESAEIHFTAMTKRKLAYLYVPSFAMTQIRICIA